MSDYKIPDNPFVGLRPFTSDESLLFFGRDQHVDGLTKPLSKNRFLAVVGSSGCGKSSLVRAGLIPRLKAGFMVYDRDEWKIAIMKPGAKPLDNFAKELLKTISQPCTEANIRAFVKLLHSYGVKAIIEYLSPILEDTHCNLLILVDQFEELFRFGLQVDDEKRKEEATYLVSLLLALADKKKCALPVYIVMTMRSDYLGDCDAFDGLPEIMNRSQYLVPRLTRAQRREAIEGPVRLYGRAISPRLVDRLLNDAGAESDQLPILQHALMRTWSEAQKNPGEDLGLGHYVTIGAIKKAISQHAEEAIGDMNKEERQLTEKIFRALTSTDPNNRRIRREAHLHDLVRITSSDQDKAWKIIQKFSKEGRSFLVTDSKDPDKNPLIDITHESLIRQWQILGNWVGREAESAQIYRRLAEDAEAHEKRKVVPWRGAQLQSALEWKEREKPNEAWAKRYHDGFENAMNFLSKSSKYRDWRLNFGTLIVALFLIAIGAVVILFQDARKSKIEKIAQVSALQLENAEQRRKNEEERARLAEAQAAKLDSVIKGLEYEKTKSASAFEKLKDEKARSDSLVGVARNSWVAAQIARQREKKLAEERRIETQLSRNQVIAGALAIKAKRQQLMENDTLSALLAQQAWHFDNMSGNKFKNEVYDALRSSLNALTESGGPIVLQHSERGWIQRVAYHPLQQIIASASGDRTIKIWKLQQTGHEQTINLKANIRDLAFSPDGKLLAAASDDGTINFWDAKTGNDFTKHSHHERVRALAFSRSHGLFASGDAGGKVLLWNLSEMSQGPVNSLSSASAVRCLAFSNADEPLLACGHEDGSLVLWQLSALDNWPKKLATQKNHQDRINSVAFSPNGEMLATGGQDDKVVLWDLSRSKMVARLPHNGPVNSVVFSPLENVLASGSSDNDIRLWDLDKPNFSPIVLNNPSSSWVMSLTFSSDGKSLVAGNSDAQIRIWTTQADVLAEKICSTVNRNLTHQEWDDFVGKDIPYEPACANFLTEKN